MLYISNNLCNDNQTWTKFHYYTDETSTYVPSTANNIFFSSTIYLKDIVSKRTMNLKNATFLKFNFPSYDTIQLV